MHTICSASGAHVAWKYNSGELTLYPFPEIIWPRWPREYMDMGVWVLFYWSLQAGSQLSHAVVLNLLEWHKLYHRGEQVSFQMTWNSGQVTGRQFINGFI